MQHWRFWLYERLHSCPVPAVESTLPRLVCLITDDSSVMLLRPLSHHHLLENWFSRSSLIDVQWWTHSEIVLTLPHPNRLLRTRSRYKSLAHLRSFRFPCLSHSLKVKTNGALSSSVIPAVLNWLCYPFARCHYISDLWSHHLSYSLIAYHSRHFDPETNALLRARLAPSWWTKVRSEPRMHLRCTRSKPLHITVAP